MKSISFLYLLIFLNSVTLFSQSTKFKIEEKYDEFEKTTSIYSLFNYLGKDKSLSNPSIQLDISLHIKDNQEYYFLDIFYSSDDWLFISEGESLVMLIDEERVGFTGKGSSSHRKASRYGVSESARYQVEPEDIIRIANAKSVKIKIVGKGSVTREFDKQNFINFKKFCDKYIGNTTVYLKDGSQHRGFLSNKVDSQFVIIKKSDGNIYKYEWQEIDTFKVK